MGNLSSRLSINFGQGSLSLCNAWLVPYHNAHPERFIANRFAADYYAKQLNPDNTATSAGTSALTVEAVRPMLSVKLSGGGAYAPANSPPSPFCLLNIAFDPSAIPTTPGGCPAVPSAFFSHLQPAAPPLQLTSWELLSLDHNLSPTYSTSPSVARLAFKSGQSGFKMEDLCNVPGIRQVLFADIPEGVSLAPSSMTVKDTFASFGLWGMFYCQASNGYRLDISPGVLRYELVNSATPARFDLGLPPLPDGLWSILFDEHAYNVQMLRQLVCNNLQVDVSAYEIGSSNIANPERSFSTATFSIKTPVSAWLKKEIVKLRHNGTDYAVLRTGSHDGEGFSIIKAYWKNDSQGTMAFSRFFYPEGTEPLIDPLTVPPAWVDAQAVDMRAGVAAFDFAPTSEKLPSVIVASCQETAFTAYDYPVAVVESAIGILPTQILELAKATLYHWENYHRSAGQPATEFKIICADAGLIELPSPWFNTLSGRVATVADITMTVPVRIADNGDASLSGAVALWCQVDSITPAIVALDMPTAYKKDYVLGVKVNGVNQVLNRTSTRWLENRMERTISIAVFVSSGVYESPIALTAHQAKSFTTESQYADWDIQGPTGTANGILFKADISIDAVTHIIIDSCGAVWETRDDVPVTLDELTLSASHSLVWGEWEWSEFDNDWYRFGNPLFTVSGLNGWAGTSYSVPYLYDFYQGSFSTADTFYSFQVRQRQSTMAINIAGTANEYTPPSTARIWASKTADITLPDNAGQVSTTFNLTAEIPVT